MSGSARAQSQRRQNVGDNSGDKPRALFDATQRVPQELENRLPSADPSSSAFPYRRFTGDTRTSILTPRALIGAGAGCKEILGCRFGTAIIIILVMPRPPTIQTERLLLLVLMPEDIEALIARDFERFAALSGFRFPPDNPDLGDLAWHLSAIQADDRHLPWRMRVIVERSSQTVVGSINLKGPPTAAGDVEIGWGLIEDVRGRGYATEASAAVIQWARQQPGVSSISATIPDDNHPSQRLAKRLGLARTSQTRRNLPLLKCDGNPAVPAR